MNWAQDLSQYILKGSFLRLETQNQNSKHSNGYSNILSHRKSLLEKNCADQSKKQCSAAIICRIIYRCRDQGHGEGIDALEQSKRRTHSAADKQGAF